jgi:hypothetical protein
MSTVRVLFFPVHHTDAPVTALVTGPGSYDIQLEAGRAVRVLRCGSCGQDIHVDSSNLPLYDHARYHYNEEEQQKSDSGSLYAGAKMQASTISGSAGRPKQGSSQQFSGPGGIRNLG